jgi:uncharacterized YccA/Bax inhibitor family protein
MAITRTANPALNKNTFRDFTITDPSRVMTLQGTVNKILLMILLLLAGAFYTWRTFFEAMQTYPETAAQSIMPWMIGGGIGGFITALVTIFKRTWAPYTAPIYAVLEGLFLGGLSAFFESMYPGIVIQAVGLTFGILIALLLAYKSRLIKPTENFKLGVVAATGGIFIVYMVSFILNLFGVPVGYIHNSSTFGIIFNLFVIVIAALNLVLDFDFIEQGAASQAPKYMEWYAAFGLMVTLIWLYIEILRLLARLAGRRS